MKHLKKYIVIAKTSLQNAVAYRASFAMDSVFYILIISIFLMLWSIIYSTRGNLEGYSLVQIIWYCIITEMVYQSRCNIFTNLNNDIKGGNIAYLLNKPYNYIAYQFSNNLGQISLKLVINSATGIIMGLLYVGPLIGFSYFSIPFIFSSILLGIILNFLLESCVGLTAFWFEDNRAFFWIFQKITFMLGMLVPLEFLPKTLQVISYVLPFSYITYGPAKLTVHFTLNNYLFILVMQTLYILILLGLALFIYGKGVKKLNVNGG